MARLRGGRLLLVGRRPGTFAAVLDPGDLSASRQLIAPAAGRRFAGHAAVSPDGASLVTSEFHAETATALLVKRDGQSGEELDRWAPGGLEPHEVLYAAHGERLLVALGGLLNDGGVAGPAANPDGVDSALLELDPRSGRELARHRLGPGLQSLSLRHLAIAPDQQSIAVGMQDQDLSRARPLLGVLRLGGKIELAPLPASDEIDFRGYVGSVAIDAGGAFVAATSPRGSALGLWSLAGLDWLGGLRLPDVCGLAAGAEAGEFWASTGLGDVLRIRALPTGPRVLDRWMTAAAFDNHLLRL
jgi:hypothetical protein